MKTIRKMLRTTKCNVFCTHQGLQWHHQLFAYINPADRADWWTKWTYYFIWLIADNVLSHHQEYDTLIHVNMWCIYSAIGQSLVFELFSIIHYIWIYVMIIILYTYEKLGKRAHGTASFVVGVVGFGEEADPLYD